MNAQPRPEFDEIQGNILAGFNKDYATFLFFALPDDQTKAKEWLKGVIDEVATTTEVAAFNALFKQIRARHHQREVVEATWMNLALSAPGLEALGVAQGEIDQLPEEFRLGMRARAAEIGDEGENAPANWPGNLGTARIDVLMVIASDSLDDRRRDVDHFVRHAARHGAVLVFQQDGMTRRDAPGHEHFGFKDGISQPGVEGFSRPEDMHPGADLIPPGEFILGYPGQPAPPTPTPGQSGYPAPPPPDPTQPQPSWLKNGSYLVFRRLAQDVAGFQEFIRQTNLEFAQSGQGQWSEDLIGAKLVGRYRSGAALEGANDATGDAGTTNPDLLKDENINNFDYQEQDAGGAHVPRAAHIRKAYPRDEDPPGEPEAERHRIIRRGIPFGHSFHRGGRPSSVYAADAAFPDDRGLCFACYQSSIKNQFEFIQQRWVNTAGFPQDRDGVDPLISQQTTPRQFGFPGAPTNPLQIAKQWVTTTGGEYFFSPAIATLKQFAGV